MGGRHSLDGRGRDARQDALSVRLGTGKEGLEKLGRGHYSIWNDWKVFGIRTWQDLLCPEKENGLDTRNASEALFRRCEAGIGSGETCRKVRYKPQFSPLCGHSPYVSKAVAKLVLGDGGGRVRRPWCAKSGSYQANSNCSSPAGAQCPSPVSPGYYP